MDFDWKSLGDTLAKIGLPILGTALLGPAGAMIGGKLAEAVTGNASSDPKSLLDMLTANADALAKAKQFEVQEKQMLLEHALAMQQDETARLKAVNDTLQADAKGTSWLQQNHHAIESLFACSLVAAIYFILPLFKLPIPSVPSEAWIMLGAILGLTAWNKGKAEVVAAGQP